MANIPELKGTIDCDFATHNRFDGYIETGVVSDVVVIESGHFEFSLNGRIHSVLSEKPDWFVSGITVEVIGRNGQVEITELVQKTE